MLLLSNGKSESVVKVIDKHQADRCGQSHFEALLEQRNTPRQDTGPSSCQMLFGRKTRTFLPSLAQDTVNSFVKLKIKKCQKSVNAYHNKSARDLPKFNIGQNVLFEHREDKRWILGKIIDILSEHTCSYLVQAQNGVTSNEYLSHEDPIMFP